MKILTLLSILQTIGIATVIALLVRHDGAHTTLASAPTARVSASENEMRRNLEAAHAELRRRQLDSTVRDEVQAQLRPHLQPLALR
jgi:hypothetical protein